MEALVRNEKQLRSLQFSVASAIDVKHVCIGQAAETGDLVKAGSRLLHPDLSFTLSILI